MPERSELYPGFKAGKLTLIQRVRGGKKISPVLRKKWRVECVCGVRLTVPEMYLVRKPNPKTHCGCQVEKTNKTLHNDVYRIWCMMRQRCYFPQHVAFRHYGGRGITIHESWRSSETGFDLFLAHIGPRPSPKHSVDRIEVDGNYEPGNVRWATSKEQAANTRAAKAAREAKK